LQSIVPVAVNVAGVGVAVNELAAALNPDPEIVTNVPVVPVVGDSVTTPVTVKVADAVLPLG